MIAKSDKWLKFDKMRINLLFFERNLKLMQNTSATWLCKGIIFRIFDYYDELIVRMKILL